MKTRNSTELKRRMEGLWLAAFSSLACDLQPAIDKLGDSVPCPKKGGTDGFRLFHDADRTGGGVRHDYRVFPEGIDLLMWVNDWTFPKAYDELEAWLEGRSVERRPMRIYVPQPVDETKRRQWLNRMWCEALPLSHLKAYPARAYFGRRRISRAALAAADLRFHPRLAYRNKGGEVVGEFGAILALVRNNDGEPVQIHRTYINEAGIKVKLGEKLKSKTITPAVNKSSKGRQVRLFQPYQGYLGVSEGLENALAVYQARTFPVWPGISDTMLRSFCPPKGVHTIVNFVDKDRSKAGENTAAVLSANLELRGIRVFNLLPPTPVLDSDEKGVDWADQLIRDPSGFDLLDRVLHSDQLKHA